VEIRLSTTGVPPCGSFVTFFWRHRTTAWRRCRHRPHVLGPAAGSWISTLALDFRRWNSGKHRPLFGACKALKTGASSTLEGQFVEAELGMVTVSVSSYWTVFLGFGVHWGSCSYGSMARCHCYYRGIEILQSTERFYLSVHPVFGGKMAAVHGQCAETEVEEIGLCFRCQAVEKCSGTYCSWLLHRERQVPTESCGCVAHAVLLLPKLEDEAEEELLLSCTWTLMLQVRDAIELPCFMSSHNCCMLAILQCFVACSRCPSRFVSTIPSPKSCAEVREEDFQHCVVYRRVVYLGFATRT
jgi:hypothetical protein